MLLFKGAQVCKPPLRENLQLDTDSFFGILFEKTAMDHGTVTIGEHSFVISNFTQHRVCEHKLTNYVLTEVRMAQKEKPPLGLKPRKLCDEARFNEIDSAIARYAAEKKDIPWEWMQELDEIGERLKLL